MPVKSTVPNAARGLFKLMQTEKVYVKDIYDCESETYIYPSHPLGLNIPKLSEDAEIREFRFLACGSPERTLQAFIANIREYIGYCDGNRVNGLRVVTAPWGDKLNWSTHHRVFFEVWVADRAIIMGDTNDFSGAGNTTREEMEDIMSALAKMNDLEIRREELGQPVDIYEL